MSIVGLARPSGRQRARRDGRTVRWAGRFSAVVPLLALIFVLATLIIEALPAIRVNGWHFFTGTDWNPGNTYGSVETSHGVAHPAGAVYGALPLIVGTLASSAIALIVAVPVSIGAALAIVGRLPERLASAVGMALEMLAGIPSVVVGLWGAMTFGPFIAHHIAPVIARNAPDVPVLDYFRGNTGNGEGMLVSGLVLAVMIIPIVASTTRDLIRQVPMLPREGATALGMSDWESVRRVTLPWVSSGIVGAVVLGLGRALGEDDGRRHGVRGGAGCAAVQHLLDHDHHRGHRSVAAGFGADRLHQLRNRDARRGLSGADADHLADEHRRSGIGAPGVEHRATGGPWCLT